MRFRNSQKIQARGKTVRRPPPDYFSRKIQYKLFALAALLMVVVVLMDRVRDPEMFRFFNSPAGDEPDSKPIPLKHPLLDPQLSLFGLPASSKMSQAEKDLQATYKDLWTAILKKLKAGEQEIFMDTLRRARKSIPLNDSQKTAWWELYQKIDLLYQKYEQQVMLSINATANALTDEQKTRGRAVLVQLRSRWTQRLRTAFLDILETPTHPELFKDEYIFIQNIIDQIALERIDDHTVFRNEDNLAWFRMLEKLGDHNEQSIRASSIARPNILELSKQQANFRGNLITVRGEIRKAYRVQARDNLQGIQQYYVLIVKPAGGGLTPLVVYCLHPPQGFQQLPDKDIDRRTADVGDLVNVTGYFFKSWAHVGSGGQMFSSPLIVAQTFQWLPGEKLPATAEQPQAAGLPGWAILIIPLTLAIGFTAVVYLMSRWNGQASLEQRTGEVKQQLATINDDDVAPSTSETLKQLAQQLTPATKPTE